MSWKKWIYDDGDACDYNDDDDNDDVDGGDDDDVDGADDDDDDNDENHADAADNCDGLKQHLSCYWKWRWQLNPYHEYPSYHPLGNPDANHESRLLF